MNAARALYVMIGIALVLAVMAAWSIDRSNKATSQAAQLTNDLRLIQQEQRSSRSERLAACDRGNTLRRKLNDYALTSKSIAEEFSAWLDTSAKFRESQGQTAGAAESRAAKRRVDGLVGLLAPMDEVNCESVIP